MNKTQIINNCLIGKGTKIYNFVNLYSCRIGDNCIIGSFVEIQEGVKVGNRVKVESHSFICKNVLIENQVFIGHHVVFINDNYPRSTTKEGKIKQEGDWRILKTIIKKRASIGSNATILGGVTIGENSIVGAGAVVVNDIPNNVIAVGNPARVIRKINTNIY